MWRLLDEDYARRNIGAEREAIIEKAQKEGLEKGMAEGLEKGMAEGLEKGMAKGIEQGMAKGIEQGMAKGIEQGIAQGEKNKSIEIAKKLKSSGIPIEVIEESTGLSKQEIEQL